MFLVFLFVVTLKLQFIFICDPNFAYTNRNQSISVSFYSSFSFKLLPHFVRIQRIIKVIEHKQKVQKSK